MITPITQDIGLLINIVGLGFIIFACLLILVAWIIYKGEIRRR